MTLGLYSSLCGKSAALIIERSAMAQRKKRGAARKATLKRGKAPKRAARTRVAKRVAAKTAPKKRMTKTKAKRAVTKKAPIKATGPPPLQDPAAAETVTVDVIEE